GGPGGEAALRGGGDDAGTGGPAAFVGVGAVPGEVRPPVGDGARAAERVEQLGVVLPRRSVRARQPQLEADPLVLLDELPRDDLGAQTEAALERRVLVPRAVAREVAGGDRQLERGGEHQERLDPGEAPREGRVQLDAGRAPADARAPLARELALERAELVAREAAARAVAIDVRGVRAARRGAVAALGGGRRWAAGVHGLRHGQARLGADQQARRRPVAALVEDAPVDPDAEKLDAATVGRVEGQAEERHARRAVERGRAGAARLERDAVREHDRHAQDQRQVVIQTE